LWKQAKLQKSALALVQDSKQSQALRIAATDALAGIGGPENLSLLQRLSTDEADRAVRLEALLRLVKADLALAAPVLSSFCHTANEAELTTLVPSLLQQKGGPPALTAALGTTKMAADMAKIGQRLARSTGQPYQPLIDAFAKAGNLEAIKWNPTPELVNELVLLSKEKGDPTRGELIFRRKELNCLKCHAIGGAGGQVGPDLSSIGSSAQPDYLVDSILLPSKNIKENYNTTVVSTTNGKIITGIKQIENNQELVLRDAEDIEVHIPIKEIEERTQGKSLMPEGLADMLTKAEFTDLVRFLSELGKVGPYAVGTSRVARTWQALVPNQAAREVISRNSLGAAATNDSRLIWNSEYTTVGGMLPFDVIPDVYVRNRGEWDAVDRQIGFVRTKLEIGTAGEVLLAFNSISGVQGWVDGSPIDMKNELRLKLNPGIHVLMFAVDKKQRTEGLRIELKEVMGSSAPARWVLGK
jgi:putative heme-binding domain-containing protein